MSPLQINYKVYHFIEIPGLDLDLNPSNWLHLNIILVRRIWRGWPALVATRFPLQSVTQTLHIYRKHSILGQTVLHFFSGKLGQLSLRRGLQLAAQSSWNNVIEVFSQSVSPIVGDPLLKISASSNWLHPIFLRIPWYPAQDWQIVDLFPLLSLNLMLSQLCSCTQFVCPSRQLHHFISHRLKTWMLSS